MRQFGLIGYPLSHSFSEGYFTKKFSEEKGFSRIIPLKEIEENDGNLNVTLYVQQDEESEESSGQKNRQKIPRSF